MKKAHKVESLHDLWDQYQYKLLGSVVGFDLSEEQQEKLGTGPFVCNITPKKGKKEKRGLYASSDKYSSLPNLFFTTHEAEEGYILKIRPKSSKFVVNCELTKEVLGTAEYVKTVKVYCSIYDKNKKKDLKRKKSESLSNLTTGSVVVRLIHSYYLQTRGLGHAPHLYFYKHNLSKFASGDLIVFSGTGLLSSYTKVSTNKPYTHFGIVVHLPNKWTLDDNLYLFELTFNFNNFQDAFKEEPRTGVNIFRLTERIHQYHGNPEIWWLPKKKKLTTEMQQKLVEWVWKMHEKDIGELEKEFSCKLNEPVIEIIAARHKIGLGFSNLIELSSPALVHNMLMEVGLIEEQMEDISVNSIISSPVFASPILIRAPENWKDKQGKESGGSSKQKKKRAQSCYSSSSDIGAIVPRKKLSQTSGKAKSTQDIPKEKSGNKYGSNEVPLELMRKGKDPKKMRMTKSNDDISKARRLSVGSIPKHVQNRERRSNSLGKLLLFPNQIPPPPATETAPQLSKPITKYQQMAPIELPPPPPTESEMDEDRELPEPEKEEDNKLERDISNDKLKAKSSGNLGQPPKTPAPGTTAIPPPLPSFDSFSSSESKVPLPPADVPPPPLLLKQDSKIAGIPGSHITMNRREKYMMMSEKFSRSSVAVQNIEGFTKDQSPIEAILKRMRDKNTGIPIGDITWDGTIYNKCFLGCDAVDWMLKNKLCQDRNEAVQLGNEMLLSSKLYHINKNISFIDGMELYKFEEEEEEKKLETENLSDVFKCSLEDLMKTQQKFSDAEVPVVMLTLIKAIRDLGGLKTEGIFRVPTSLAELQRLRQQFDSGNYSVSTMRDAHLPACLLKLWLRELPSALIPPFFYNYAIYCTDDPERRAEIMDALPISHYNVIKYLTEFLVELSTYAEYTKMDLSNLAMVFSPCFLRCPANDPLTVMECLPMEGHFVNRLFEDFAAKMKKK